MGGGGGRIPPNLKYDVYLGKSEKLAGGDKKSTFQKGNTYQVKTALEVNTKYYWQVVAKNRHNLTTKSEIYSFTTPSAHNANTYSTSK